MRGEFAAPRGAPAESVVSAVSQEEPSVQSRPRSRQTLRLAGMLAGACLGLGVAAPAPGQNAGQGPASEQSVEQLLEDFTHFVTIRQIELAESYAQAILDRGLSPTEFVGIVEDEPRLRERFQNKTREALFISELEDEAAALQTLYEQGRLERARDPQEIARNIQLLTENPRARMLARERLAFAGEYAVPQMLEVLLSRSNQALEALVEQLLIDMGGDAVVPLNEALLGVDETTQARLALILGRMQLRVSLPYLYDLLRSTDAESVRENARRAIALIQRSSVDPNISLAELYWQLGERYYTEPVSLTRFEDESHQLLWTYDPGVGLYATPIRTEVFHEARAMEVARRALEIDPNHEGAGSLWLAANFSREIDSPEGYQNPVYDKARGARYYAVAAGSEPAQRVLARALAERDTPLAREVIAALSLGAGGAGLWEGLGAERPLIDALSYPDRRVQYEAALAIGRAKPRAEFSGSDRVTPILAGAVRNAAERFAIVIATDAERRQELFDILIDLEYDVLQTAGSLEEAASAIAEAPGVDMIVSDLTRDRTLTLIERVRTRSKLRVTPVLALLPQRAWNTLWPRFQNEPLTDVVRAGVSDEQLSEAIRQLAVEASGPRVTDEEATEYALRSLDVLRDLAISRNAVFAVEDAATPLTEAMDETSGEVRMRIADVLARVDRRSAQVALMDAALDAEGGTRVELLQRVAESAKAYGNRLDDRQVNELLTIASESENDAEATAAAALVGVLNLPQSSVTTLILESA